MCEEVPQHSVEMEALLAMSSKLQPTLDVNDKTTMKQTVANLSERLDALREAADQQKNAQKYLQDYQTFQVRLESSVLMVMKNQKEKIIYQQYRPSVNDIFYNLDL